MWVLVLVCRDILDDQCRSQFDELHLRVRTQGQKGLKLLVECIAHHVFSRKPILAMVIFITQPYVPSSCHPLAETSTAVALLEIRGIHNVVPVCCDGTVTVTTLHQSFDAFWNIRCGAAAGAVAA